MPPSPLNVAAHLARMAADHPARPAVHVPRRGVKPDGPSEHLTLTFAGLNADADAVAHGLAACGIGRGVRTALMVPPGADFFALTFALFKVAAVPVLVDPGMGVRNLGRCLAEAEPVGFVGVPKAHLARRLLGWAKRTVRATVNVGRGRFFCRHALADLRESGKGRGPYPVPGVAADEPAAVLFTSGSTGPAKGAEYTHGNFAAQVEALKATYRIEPGEVDLCTFPLFALFGPALGMTCVVPDMDATRPARIDPRKAVAQVRQFGVTNLFGSPAVVRRLGELTAPLPTLRRVISAGAPASAAAVERLAKLLPATAEVFTPYGATEALPVANVGSREILGETRHLTEQGKGVCVGRPVPGVEVRIIRISDGPIPEWDDTLRVPAGEVGEVVVRGAVVTRRYVNRPEATGLAKIRDARTGEVFHRMGDVGYLDEQGRLWFCGRKAHRVETPHGPLFTDMVEPVFNTVPGVFRTALVGVARGGRTYPVLCVELTPVGIRADRRKRWARFAGELRDAGRRLDHVRPVTTFLEHPGFPVDVRHNSKIFREKLAAWANKRLGRRWRPAVAAEAAR
ncbi:MAG: peptide synthase [Isosphaera sp.]|nr:peptide synthase [Isosphaera sp.]